MHRSNASYGTLGTNHAHAPELVHGKRCVSGSVSRMVKTAHRRNVEGADFEYRRNQYSCLRFYHRWNIEPRMSNLPLVRSSWKQRSWRLAGWPRPQAYLELHRDYGSNFTTLSCEMCASICKPEARLGLLSPPLIGSTNVRIGLDFAASHFNSRTSHLPAGWQPG